jgi:glycerophosphoryl diester phosphodiesterase
MKPLIEIINSKKIFVAAHRGFSKIYPENTMSAFKSAIELCIDIIEVDIQFSKDEQIIVYHNDVLRNTNHSISNLNFDDLKHFDNGSWFSEEFKNERIPLLCEVINELHSKAYLIIEIKPLFSEFTKRCIDNLISLLCETNYISNVVIASFDVNNISYIKTVNSKINTAAIFLPDSKLLPNEIKNECNCDAIICYIDELNKLFSDNATANNIFLGVYGAETKADLEKCISHNVKVVGSDHPEKILNLLNTIQL